MTIFHSKCEVEKAFKEHYKENQVKRVDSIIVPYLDGFEIAPNIVYYGYFANCGALDLNYMENAFTVSANDVVVFDSFVSFALPQSQFIGYRIVLEFPNFLPPPPK